SSRRSSGHPACAAVCLRRVARSASHGAGKPDDRHPSSPQHPPTRPLHAFLLVSVPLEAPRDRGGDRLTAGTPATSTKIDGGRSQRLQETGQAGFEIKIPLFEHGGAGHQMRLCCIFLTATAMAGCSVYEPPAADLGKPDAGSNAVATGIGGVGGGPAAGAPRGGRRGAP